MKPRQLGLCLVCNDAATGINFGVPTCMPCKAFFRRNAVKLGTHEFVCQHDGNCIITYKYRRSCNCCRLAKCFRVGMKRSFILSDEEREARNRLVAINRLKRGKLPKLTSIAWMQPPSLLQITTNSAQFLSSTDQILLANIYYVYEDTCIAAKNTYLKCFPAIQHTTVHGFVNEVSSELEVSIKYLKRIPEFNNLKMDDKVRLIRNHIGTIIHVNEPLMYPEASINLIGTWTNILGLGITKRLLKRNQVIEQYILDPIILKVILIILVLSSGNNRNVDQLDLDSICDDSLSIFTAQNVYVELLWKYILSRSASERDAVKFFNRLIMFVLFAEDLHLEIDKYVSSLRNEIQQMEPIMQNMWPRVNSDEDINDGNINQDV